MKWEDGLLEFMKERREMSLRALECARKECKDRNKWKLQP